MAKSKLLSAAVVAASITGGGVAGLVLGVPALSSAQESDGTTTTEAPSTETPSTEAEGCEGRGFGRGIGLRFLDPAVAADALGMTEDELREALDSDTSIADLATERGVDVQSVIDALVADATAAIDEAVASGDLDSERAAAIKENLGVRVTNFVNRVRPDRPEGGGGHRGPGGWADDGDSADEGSTDEG